MEPGGSGLRPRFSMVAGFSRGIWGEAFTGLIDAVLLIPVLPLLVVLAAYVGQSIFNIVLVISCMGWCSTARVVRVRVLQLRETEFVEALRALGFSRMCIVFYHLLPNVFSFIFIECKVRLYPQLSERNKRTYAKT